jgi:hypothetical protein
LSNGFSIHHDRRETQPGNRRVDLAIGIGGLFLAVETFDVIFKALNNSPNRFDASGLTSSAIVTSD